jgi:hypothetical protein
MKAAINKPSENGHDHLHNGHAPANRLPDAVQPLNTVSTARDPKAEAESEGRTAKGTFAAGNTFARGNPNARKMAALRSALLSNLTAEKVTALGDKLFELAMAGDLAALKLLLLYGVGKPPDAVDADRLDLDEWRSIEAAPTITEFIEVVVAGGDPNQAAELLTRLRPGAP